MLIEKSQHTLKDMVILIAGAAGGLGSAIAKIASSKGAKLILADIRGKYLLDLCEKMSIPHDSFIVECDFADSMRTAELAEKTIEKFQGINCLINAVGYIGYYSPVSFTCQSDFKKILNSNLQTVFNLATNFDSILRMNKGCTVFFEDKESEENKSCKGVYSAIKKASSSLFETWKKESPAIKFLAINTPKLNSNLRIKTQSAETLAILEDPENFAKEAMNIIEKVLIDSRLKANSN